MSKVCWKKEEEMKKNKDQILINTSEYSYYLASLTINTNKIDKFWKKASNFFCCVIDNRKADCLTCSANDKAELIS